MEFVLLLGVLQYWGEGDRPTTEPCKQFVSLLVDFYESTGPKNHILEDLQIRIFSDWHVPITAFSKKSTGSKTGEVILNFST